MEQSTIDLREFHPTRSPVILFLFFLPPNQVRNERNVAREEVKRLQTQLNHVMKESNTYRRQKQNLEMHNEQMRKELEQIHVLLLKHVGKKRLLDR